MKPTYVLGSLEPVLTQGKKGSTPILNIPNQVKQIVGGSNSFLILDQKNILYYKSSTNKLKKFDLKKKIKKISTNYQSQIILAEDGSLYTLVMNNSMNVSTFKDKQFRSSEPTPITFFSKNNLKVRDIVGGCQTNFFILDTNDAYGVGYNQDGQLGIGIKTPISTPQKCFTNVKEIFMGPQGLSTFFITQDLKVYSCGRNSWGTLGLNTAEKVTRPQQLLDFDGADVKQITMTYQTSFLLTNDSELFSCGNVKHNGFGDNTTNYQKFTKIPFFENKKKNDNIPIRLIYSGTSHTVALFNDNAIYAWGTSNACEYGLFKMTNTPQKVKVPEITPNDSITISCSYRNTFIYPSSIDALRQDLEIFLKNKEFSDCLFGGIYQAHKLLVELRMGKTINEINEIIQNQNYTKKIIMDLLNWIYTDELLSEENNLNLINHFQILQPETKSIRDDLLKLYKDEDTKDFSILVAIDDDYNEDYNDDDNEIDEPEVEEIPVHKLILLIRSGLFRDMFKDIKKNTTSVKDYSHKTFESLEILIKFFYTETIELTADDDPELIISELEDAFDYYKLNKNSSINSLLNSLKKYTQSQLK
ncbi:hypothetical protein M0812_24092 [Anaeramoeba flamelloides]|uniref:BTB domain-containing protein n=1 Tax=Anaeramoeba flamelloides TaxID=1746091 RepID=A0AAV7YG74_9EUKA|nr:hypothetical protein M0812_24092 [Anaeramoeba flamelloides]